LVDWSVNLTTSGLHPARGVAVKSVPGACARTAEEPSRSTQESAMNRVLVN
jgi:hypothetical protein